MAEPQTTHRLLCVECDEHSNDEARRWRVLLTDDGDLVAYCPGCAEREFGGNHSPLADG